MKVAELMTKDVYTVGADDSLAEAARIMWEQDCGAVPVLEHGKLRGIITDRDCCMAAYINDTKLASMQVRNHMSKNVFRVAPNDEVHVAEQLMRDKQVRRLPVVDGEDRLVGLVSLADLARNVATNAKKGGDKILPQEVATTLSGISQERSFSPGASHA